MARITFLPKLADTAEDIDGVLCDFEMLCLVGIHKNKSNLDSKHDHRTDLVTYP